MSDLPTVWKPKALQAGSDLLPLNLFGQVEKIDRRGRENIEDRDMILPTLRVLTGTSKPITEGRDGAKVGRFYLSGAEMFFDAPLRVLLCAHTRSRAMFPNELDPDFKGVDTCISRDALRGNVYGLCEDCKYRKWRGENEKTPPMCFESQNFVALTPHGPAMMRFAKTSYKAARQFLTEWNLSPYPMWEYPCIVTAQLQTKTVGGKQQPYYVMDIRWQRGENVPPAAQEAAWLIHQQVKAAYEAGRFGADDDGEEQE